MSSRPRADRDRPWPPSTGTTRDQRPHHRLGGHTVRAISRRHGGRPGHRGARRRARRRGPGHGPYRGDLLRQRAVGPADRPGVRARTGRPAPFALRGGPDGQRGERVRERVDGAAPRLPGDRIGHVRDRRRRRIGEDVAPGQAALDSGARRGSRRRSPRWRSGGSQRVHGQLRRTRSRADRAQWLEPGRLRPRRRQEPPPRRPQPGRSVSQSDDRRGSPVEPDDHRRRSRFRCAHRSATAPPR